MAASSWRHKHPGARLFAAGAAISLTALILLMLGAAPDRALLHHNQASRVRLMIFAPTQLKAAPPPTHLSRRLPADAPTQPTAAAPSRSSISLAPPLIADRPLPEQDFENRAALPPAVPASAPLRLDQGVVRNAAAASKGIVQRMAEASGQTLGDAAPSVEARMGETIQRAHIGDCVGPNPEGSLLSIPLIALAALAGRCKQ